ncbi:amino acid adenylation domain-containing protein [Micromonospora sp. WMMD729]|uniref:amino acid adenylation domain-containing protein n=1 Tax=Micromonospora sp. WMMD729 TaxID=3404127 RepID=UPI003BF5FDC6
MTREVSSVRDVDQSDPTGGVGIHGYLAEWARRTPDAPAVVADDEQLTYAELATAARRLAAGLARAGVSPGDRVVLWSDKRAGAVALMQAALSLGAPYVPVSAANPPARVWRIAADCAATVVIADGPAADRVAREGGAPDGPPMVSLDELARWGAEADVPPVHRPEPDDPAYILYTSGSTGAPKGVCLSHRNAAAFVEWAGDLLAVSPRDRLANHAPFNFDLSVFDLYAAFRAGASVHLVPAELAYAPVQLARFVRDEGITIWYSVPSALTLMIRDGGLLDGPPPPTLRACVFAGEVMPIRYVHELRAAWPGVRLLNWYGPTETNVCASYEVTDVDEGRDRPLPIGRPASGAVLTLVPPDPDGAAGTGECPEGEIVADGPTVMLGYWGREPQRGPYRTGDLGRLASDGTLEYLGRRDDMAKVRGNRVEPGEIEAVLAAHPDVAAAAVVVAGVGLAARLHAVVVPAGDRRPGLLEIKRWCAGQLPTYMIVDSVQAATSLPLTPNGKTDRAALLAAIEGGGPLLAPN